MLVVLSAVCRCESVHDVIVNVHVNVKNVKDSMYRCRFLNVNLTVVNQERGKDGGWTCNDEAEHFSLIPELEPRSAWMSQHCQQVRTNLKAYMCVSQETSREVIS